MNIADIIVPRWYSQARKEGSTAEKLRDTVADFCLRAILHEVKRNGGDPTIIMDPEFIDMTIATYEEALMESQKNDHR